MNLNFKHPLQNDNVFVDCKILPLSEITHKPTRKGLEKVIISEGEVVNVVSKSYGHLPNEHFFYEAEKQLINAGIQYATRSINRANRSFAVDYILQDDSCEIKVKHGTDRIKPMLRFVNSYDGSCPMSGHFGFFREICSNGLHVAHSQIGFSIKHKGNICSVVFPEISQLVQKFLNNEFYSLHRKFEVLAETPLTDVEGFVKLTAERLKLFVFQSSERNPEPSKNARIVIDSIYREADLLGEAPNHWIGYNAFNSLLHNKLKRPFGAQKQLDAKIFEAVQIENQ